MLTNRKILFGTGETPAYLLPKMSTRHGAIFGSTGSGKSVSLRVLCEGMVSSGTPVLIIDAKGDMDGSIIKGEMTPEIARRIPQELRDSFTMRKFETQIWCPFGERGLPINIPISDLGPLLLSRLLMLNEVQSGVINIAFAVAKDENLPLDTLDDFETLLSYVSYKAPDYRLRYGQIANASLGAIQRGLGVLKNEGGDILFKRTNFKLSDFVTIKSGEGVINVLDATELIKNPMLYSTVLLWILTEIQNQFPELGSVEKPIFSVIMDEASSMFKNTSRLLATKIEQSVKMLRSKGVSLWLSSQQIGDVPPPIISQLNNRILHSIRAYSPQDLRGVKAAANSFRQNPNLDCVQEIQTLKTGEVLCSFLQEDGSPSIVTKATVLPPQSSLKTVDEAVRAEHIKQSPLYHKYTSPNWWEIFTM